MDLVRAADGDDNWMRRTTGSYISSLIVSIGRTSQIASYPIQRSHLNTIANKLTRSNLHFTPISTIIRSFSVTKMQENLTEEGFKPCLPSKLLNETGLKLKEKLYQDIHLVEKELSVDLDERDAFFRLVIQNFFEVFQFNPFCSVN